MWFVWWLILTIVTEILRPKAQVQNPEPTAAGDVQVPTSEQGRVVPIACGTVKITGINTLDAWGLVIRQIYDEVSTGWFSSEEVFKYEEFYLSCDIGVCQGFDENDYSGGSHVADILLDDKSIIEGASVVEQSTFGKKYSISKPELWGSADEGGVVGKVEICYGRKNQPSSQVLIDATGNHTGHRGLLHIIFGGVAQQTNLPLLNGLQFVQIQNDNFLWGHQKYLPQPAIIVQRTPLVMEWSSSTNPAPVAEYWNISGGMNPAVLAWEMFVRFKSPAVPLELMDMPSFIKCANTLKSEGLGYFGQLDQASGQDAYIQQIEKMVDAVIDTDEKTGKVSMKLIRNDYNEEDLFVFDSSNVSDLISWSRPAPQQTINRVKLTYVDFEAGTFDDKSIVVEDISNILFTGSERTVELSMGSIGTHSAAMLYAKRYLQQQSFPLATCTIQTTAEHAQLLTRGDPVIFDWSAINPDIPRLVYRITKITKAGLTSQTSEIELVQDLFGDEQVVSGNSSGNGSDWRGTPELASFYCVEVPYEFTDVQNTVALAVARSNFQTYNYILEKDGKYSDKFSVNEKIVGNVGMFSNSITITGAGVDAYLINATPETKSLKKSIAIINPNSDNPEWIAFGGVTFNEVGTTKTITLSDVSRGRFGTAPKAYSNDTPISVFVYSSIISTVFEPADQNISVTPQGSGGYGDKLTKTPILNDDVHKPYLHDNIVVNNKKGGSLTNNLVFGFTSRDRNACKSSSSLISESSPAQATNAVLYLDVKKNNSNVASYEITNGQTITKEDFNTHINLESGQSAGLVFKFTIVQTIDGQQRQSESIEYNFDWTFDDGSG